MSFAVKVDVLDLIIDVLREHERSLSRLVRRLEAASVRPRSDEGFEEWTTRLQGEVERSEEKTPSDVSDEEFEDFLEALRREVRKRKEAGK